MTSCNNLKRLLCDVNMILQHYFSLLLQCTFPLGVIPRAVKEIFDTINSLQQEANSCGRPSPSFEIHVQFLEVCFLVYTCM